MDETNDQQLKKSKESYIENNNSSRVKPEICCYFQVKSNSGSFIHNSKPTKHKLSKKHTTSPEKEGVVRDGGPFQIPPFMPSEVDEM